MNVAADQYAVAGNPIEHSKSPVIHSLFAEQTGEKIRYGAILAPVDGFEKTVAQFFEDQGKGLNVTVPFKQEAWALADRLTGRAQRAGAVNTLWKDEQGVLWGDTTDGVGLICDIVKNHGHPVAGKRVLVLGAGGAVRGILEPLLEQSPSEVVIANRTVSRAEDLAKLFAKCGHLTASGFESTEGAFDLVINGTSTSLQGECPPLPDSSLTPETVVYDMMYGAGETVFNQWASQKGAGTTIDGLGMLVEQAAESFSIWRNVRPETRPVVAKIREILN